MRSQLKRLVERLADVHIFRTPPSGLSVTADIHRWLPRLEVRVVFDVGANTGQSTNVYAQAFPEATIHCFEPATPLFKQLVQNVGGRHGVQCHQVALSSTAGEQPFIVYEVFSRIPRMGESLSGHEMETVKVDRLSDFCNREKIDRINFLKIDTEGHDLEVLRGADELLRQNQIDLIQVEAGLNPYNDVHVPMEKFKGFLEEREYMLFGIYEQTHEWSGEPHLRRADLTFMSRRIWSDPAMKWR